MDKGPCLLYGALDSIEARTFWDRRQETGKALLRSQERLSIQREVKHGRDLTLGSDQWAAINSCVVCVGDADAMDARPARFHRIGLAFSDWSPSGENSLATFLAEIGSALVYSSTLRRH